MSGEKQGRQFGNIQIQISVYKREVGLLGGTAAPLVRIRGRGRQGRKGDRIGYISLRQPRGTPKRAHVVAVTAAEANWARRGLTIALRSYGAAAKQKESLFSILFR